MVDLTFTVETFNLKSAFHWSSKLTDFLLLGDERDCPTADGAERLLQSGEARRVHQYSGCSVPGSHDSSGGRPQRHSTKAEKAVLHL